eukprot:augustus_masked-scaffold_7-processed-gene-9.59-mRNA-1 protein AED:0.22 eAED:0.22 QI:0/0/0/0.5/1/1/2/0/272
MFQLSYFIASSGIGRALAIHFSDLKFQVYAVARREQKLEELKSETKYPENIHTFKFDLTDWNNIGALTDNFVNEGSEPPKFDFVVQNAGTLGQMKPFGELDAGKWKAAYDLNVHSPLFLAQKMLNENMFAAGARILHVGTGAAHVAIPSWLPYCTTKTAFFAMYRCLAAEFKQLGVDVSIASFMPGVVESEMQQAIRSTDENDFPMKQMFVDFKKEMKKMAEEKNYAPPEDGVDNAFNVAKFVEFLLLETNKEEYEKEWDIREKSLFARWIK